MMDNSRRGFLKTGLGIGIAFSTGCDFALPKTEEADLPAATPVITPPIVAKVIDNDGSPHELSGADFKEGETYIIRGGPLLITSGLGDNITLFVENRALQIDGQSGNTLTIESAMADEIILNDVRNSLKINAIIANVRFNKIGADAEIFGNNIYGGTAGHSSSLVAEEYAGTVEFDFIGPEALTNGQTSFVKAAYIGFSGKSKNTVLQAGISIGPRSGQEGDLGDLGVNSVAYATESITVGDIGEYSTIQEALTLSALSIGSNSNIKVREQATIENSIGCNIDFRGTPAVSVNGQPLSLSDLSKSPEPCGP